ncbi:MAG TPA: hypothetical protein ENI80_05330 [Acidiferrobacteraceae bacterium]|nr:hypothetical protein [Acidiferrobacteraceae bacterium]
MHMQLRLKIARQLIIIGLLPSLAWAGPVERDVHVQNGADAVRLDIDRRTYNEVTSLLKDKMSTASVLFHAVNLGVTINDAVYLAIKADRETTGGANAAQIYAKATELLPYLPGDACSSVDSGTDRYRREININDLGPAANIQTVADRFIQNNERVGPFPSWKNGDYHMTADLNEVKSLRDKNWGNCSAYKPVDSSVQSGWYKADGDQARSSKKINMGGNCNYDQPIFVSLYRTTSEKGGSGKASDKKESTAGQGSSNGCVIIDDNLKQVERAASQGCTKAPVVFLYNEKNEYPIGILGKDVTLNNVAERFWDSGLRATAVPDEHDKDRHLDANIDELANTFKQPISELESKLGKEEFNSRVTETLKSLSKKGFGRPVQVTILRNKAIFTDDLLRIAALKRAKDAGDTSVPQQVPTVALFHEVNRLACGVGATTCRELVCDAAVAGGADPSICTEAPAGGRQTSGVPPPPTVPRNPSPSAP